MKQSQMVYLPHEKEICDVQATIEHLKRQNENNALFTNEIKKLEQKLQQLKEKVYSELTPWERVQICRHPDRPHTVDYIEQITDRFIELHGDRRFADDQ